MEPREIADALRALLGSRPHPPTRAAPPPGIHPAGIVAGGRDGLLVIPEGHRADRPAPLVVALHGAGGEAGGVARLLEPFARTLGAVLLAPESAGGTWDVVRNGLGPDVLRIDQALARVFDRIAIDPEWTVIAGFSDGASYALTLGLANGGLFRAVAAFSPGFEAAPARRGRPTVFVSHGTGDRVLRIGATSRRIVPELLAAGYDVGYREFDGGHGVPREVQEEAAAWLLGAARDGDPPTAP